MNFRAEDFIEGRRKGIVTVVGGGYVGLPLAITVAAHYSNVIVFDIDQEKVDNINRGEPYIGDVSPRELQEAVNSERLSATTDPELAFSSSDVVLVCVPTPLQGTREPDLSFVTKALDSMIPYLATPCLVCLESTVYPGFTRDVIAKRLSVVGTIGKDVFVSFSPERVDPANRVHRVDNTPKVVGGVTPRCTELAASFYQKVIKAPIIAVEDSTTAEMVKLLENTFRSVNIALANEFAQACRVVGVDVWRVIEAARTKPMGFMPFWPGPGVGGHCIAVDPVYLSWKVRDSGLPLTLIETAEEVNVKMPHYIVRRATGILNDMQLAVNGSKILVVGVAYKRDVVDTRESPALEIIKELQQLQAKVSYHDPLVPEVMGMKSREFEVHAPICVMAGKPKEGSPRERFDLSIIATDHDTIEYQRIVECSDRVLDTRDAMRRRGVNMKGSRLELL